MGPVSAAACPDTEPIISLLSQQERTKFLGKDRNVLFWFKSYLFLLPADVHPGSRELKGQLPRTPSWTEFRVPGFS